MTLELWYYDSGTCCTTVVKVLSLINFEIKQEEENQKRELKKIRQNLRGGFLEIGGFLLPYPGTDVSINHQYDGKVKGR